MIEPLATSEVERVQFLCEIRINLNPEQGEPDDWTQLLMVYPIYLNPNR
jgi:hypothetical protein